MVKVTGEARRTLPGLHTRIGLSSGLIILRALRQALSDGAISERARWEDSVRVDHLGSESHQRSPRYRKGIRLTRLDQSRKIVQTRELDNLIRVTLDSLRIFEMQSYG